jgi:hypothetical protein
MRDFGAAIGLVLAIERLLMAGFAGAMRTCMATTAVKAPKRLRGSVPAPRSSGLPACFFSALFGEAASGRTNGRM